MYQVQLRECSFIIPCPSSCALCAGGREVDRKVWSRTASKNFNPHSSIVSPAGALMKKKKLIMVTINTYALWENCWLLKFQAYKNNLMQLRCPFITVLCTAGQAGKLTK